MLGSVGGLICSAVERQLSRGRRRLFDLMTMIFAGALVGWLVLLVAEYEYNVSFFATVFHPLLLAGLPSFALVLIARLSPYRWPATTVALGFTLFRVLVAGWLMTTAGSGLAGDTRPLIPILILSGVAVDVMTVRRFPAWLAGAAAGFVTLGVNAVYINVLHATSGHGNPWPFSVVMSAFVPALIVAALAGSAGAWVARSLQPRLQTAVKPPLQPLQGEVL